MTETKITKLSVNMTIVAKKNPEWGTWKVLYRYHENIWIIRGESGERTLEEAEARRCWELA